MNIVVALCLFAVGLSTAMMLVNGFMLNNPQWAARLGVLALLNLLRVFLNRK